MALNSDRDGFLVPDERLSGDDLSQGIKGIKQNTDAILSILKTRARSLDRARVANPNSQRQRAPAAQGSAQRAPRSTTAAPAAPSPRASRSGGSGGGSAPERARDSRGRFIAQPLTPIATAVRQFTRQQAQQAAEQQRAEAAQRSHEGEAGSAQPRDARGRFGSGGGRGGAGGGDGEDGEGGGSSKDKKEGLFARLKDALSDKGGSIGEVSKVDPAIESAKEVMGMVGGAVGALKTTGKIGRAVLGRGVNGRDSEGQSVPWYRKIFQQLKLIRHDDGAFHRAELRALDDLRDTEAHNGGGHGGGSAGEDGGGLGGMLSKVLPGGLGGALKMGGRLLGGVALPAAAIYSAIKSYGTDTGEYAKRMGIEAPKSLAGDLGVRAAGVMGDLGNTLTFGMADKLGKSELVSGLVDKTAGGLSKAKDWMLGKTSKNFESGKRGAGAVSTGKGDNGGVSYGDYQMSSKVGTIGDFMRMSKYGKDFAGLKPGTPEFSAKWKQIAASDPDFGAEQYNFMKQSHYDPQMAKLKKEGIDLSGRGNAVQDAIWSTSVQFGGETSLIQTALKGKDVSKMSDADIIAAIQDYKIANNDKLFKSSNANVRAGTLARAGKEKTDLLKLAAQPSVSPAGSSSDIGASLASTIPAMGESNTAVLSKLPALTTISVAPQAAPPPAAPASSPVPLSSKAPMEVTVRNNSPLASQDVKDRRLAHIATGGMSGS